jgi:multidrug efflux system membrane fusion protein
VRLAAVTLVLAGLVSALAGCGGRKHAGGPPPVPVTAATATVQPTPLSLLAVGNVEPIQSVSVRPQVGGVITKVEFSEGEDVQAGQVLFQIDPRPLQAALDQARAQLARDQAQAENARTQAERYERLVARDYVTKEQYDAMHTEAEALQASVEADQAAVDQARLNLAYASVKAPIAGRTGAVLVKLGNVVAPNGSPLVVINQLRPIRVAFTVPGAQLPLVQKYGTQGGLTVRIRQDNDEGDSADAGPAGRLVFVDNTVDPSTGTVALKAEFANANGALWPGQFLNVELVLAVQSDALTVPASAVVAGQQGQFAYVIGPDNKVQPHPVQVDRTVEGVSVIRSGLAAGDVVVTDGQLRLVPGATVQVKPGTPGTESAGSMAGAAQPGTSAPGAGQPGGGGRPGDGHPGGHGGGRPGDDQPGGRQPGGGQSAGAQAGSSR